MPEACDQTACCSGSEIGSIVIGDCGSAICSVINQPIYYQLPFTFDAGACDHRRLVYTTLKEQFDYELSGTIGEVGDYCYRIATDPPAQWGTIDTTSTPDTYCVAFPGTPVRETYGDQLQFNCANLTFDPGGGLVFEFIEDTQIFQQYLYTADSGAVTFTWYRVLILSGEIDLDTAAPGCALENGFENAYKVGCGGVVELLSRTPIPDINLVGRMVSTGTSISGFALRPYKIIEEVTRYCPTRVETTCQSFPKNNGTDAPQADCVTLIPGANTSLRVEAGAC
jgi:hypothetical protein